MKFENILGKKILVVTAHPDDESFLCAGLLWLNHGHSGQNFLVCATLGEKGRAHLDEECSSSELKSIRKAELQNALEILHIGDYQVFDYPDGGLVGFAKSFQADVLAAIEKWKPDIIVGFGRDGFTGHMDHAVASGAASEAAKFNTLPYLAFAFPSTKLGEQYIEHLCKKRSHDKYHSHDEIAIGDICVEVDTETKLSALQCYKSQWKGLNPSRIFPPHLAEHFLQFEYFKVLE